MSQSTDHEIEVALSVTPKGKIQPFIHTKVSMQWWLALTEVKRVGIRAAFAVLYTRTRVRLSRNLVVYPKAYTMCGLTRKTFTEGLWHLERAKLTSVNRDGRAVVSVNLVNYK
jgi:hypothetical protein